MQNGKEKKVYTTVMNKIEKVKVALDVVLYYFTIYTVFDILSITLPYLLFKGGMEISDVLRSYAPGYVPFIVVIIFLAIFSKLLKKKVQGSISLENKPLIFIIVGMLLIITGVTSIISYVSIIGIFLEHLSPNESPSLMDGIYRVIVSIVVCVVQIGIGTCITFIAIKREKQIEKIRVALDVALYYFAITTVLNLVSKIVSDSLFKSNRELISGLKLGLLYYAVLAVVIFILAILSNTLKKKVHGCISINSKSLILIIVGVLLIINGVTSIPTEVSWISLYHIRLIETGISQIEETQYLNTIYWAISHIVFYTFQIAVGAYFTFKAIKRDKHIEATY